MSHSDEDQSTTTAIQLVYASAASVAFDQADLRALLAKSRTNNARDGVTGVLLYIDETFFQVLEGDPTAVQRVYDRIAADPRHENVLLLARREVEQRNFGDWSMGYVHDRSQLAQLPGFIDFFDTRTFLDLKGDSARIQEILSGFRRGRWRRQATTETAGV